MEPWPSTACTPESWQTWCPCSLQGFSERGPRQSPPDLLSLLLTLPPGLGHQAVGLSPPLRRPPESHGEVLGQCWPFFSGSPQDFSAPFLPHIKDITKGGDQVQELPCQAPRKCWSRAPCHGSDSHFQGHPHARSGAPRGKGGLVPLSSAAL